MPRSTFLQTGFVGGELSPLMHGRSDLARWRAGARELLNFLPHPLGAVTRRPGTEYVAAVETHSKRGWLSTFRFSRSDAYVLEWGDETLRLFAQGGRVLDGSSPLEVATPYDLDELTDDDGHCRLRTTQSGDVLYVTNGVRRPYTLTRNGATDWSMDFFSPTGGPWAAENDDSGVTVHVSAASGSGVTITSNSAIFASHRVNTLIRIYTPDSHNYDEWEASRDYADDDIVRSGTNVYEATRAARSGTVQPAHASGTARDGTDFTGDGYVNGVDWLYRHSGYGWARITAVAGNGLSATANVLSRFPDEVLGSGNASPRWQWSAWNSVDGYPEAVGFYAERLVFARGRTLWFSVTDDFTNFRDKDAGEVKADSAITITLGGTGVNRTLWLEESGVGLIVGTDGGEYLVRRGSDAQVFGAVEDAARNIRWDRQSVYGSAPVAPAVAHDRVLYATRTARTLRELQYRFEGDRLAGLDLSIVAEHLLAAGVVQLAWQGEPDNLLWCLLADGTLASLSYLPEQELLAWARHATRDGDAVESVASIPAPDGSADELWLLVRRAIGGTKRYVERMSPRWAIGGDATDSAHLDCSLSREGSSTSTLTGLGHLNGAECAVWVNGSRHPNRTPASGSIALERASTTARVGLGYASRLVLLDPEPGAAEPSMAGRAFRISELLLRLLDCGPARAGATVDRLADLFGRQPGSGVGSAPALFSGDKALSIESDWDTTGGGAFVVEGNGPAVVLAVARKLDAGDR